MARLPVVMLVGCPNVGKSVLFHALTGKYVAVSNYPGTTVEVTRGHAVIGKRRVEVVDSPGVYGLPAVSEEERSVVEMIGTRRPDVIVQVVSAVELGRMLALSRWLLLTGIPLVLVVNMMDEAVRQRVRVDVEGLQRELGIRVVGCSAVRGEGIAEVREAVEQALARPDRGGKMLSGCSVQAEELNVKFVAWGAGLARRVVDRAPRSGPGWDYYLLHPLWGTVIGVVVFYVVCVVVVGQLSAGIVVDLLDHYYLLWVEPYVSRWSGVLPGAVAELIGGEFGLATLGLRYALIIILPIVTGFFVAFSVLEDVGYLPRLSVVVDRLMRMAGLSGASAIPLTLGLGCGTMATIFTRILSSNRERILATFLLALVVPCSAQLGVITGLLSLYPAALLVWGLTIGLVAAVAGYGCSRLLPGQTPPLVMELPPIRMPMIQNIMAKVASRVGWYGREVVPMLGLISVGLWASDRIGLLAWVEGGLVKALSWARLPPEVARAVLLGFFRRDYGAAGLFAVRDQLTVAELTVSAVLLTLSFPCAAQVAVMFRERGWQIGLGIAIAVAVITVGVSVGLGRVLIGG